MGFTSRVYQCIRVDAPESLSPAISMNSPLFTERNDSLDGNNQHLTNSD